MLLRTLSSQLTEGSASLEAAASGPGFCALQPTHVMISKGQHGARAVSLDNMMLEPDDLSGDPGDIESPEDYALRRELGKLINEGLTHLPTDQRLVVVLCDIQGLSYEEVAQVSGCSLGTVKSRLNRGRARLRDFLTQHEELLPFNFRLNKQGGAANVSFQKGSPLPEGTGDAL